MVSIVIIALLAAMATPSFVAMMRDRRVVRAGLMLADTYREARTRALSRGNAVMVRWTAGATGKGTIETRESIIAPAGLGVATGCLTSSWDAASLNTRPVSSFDFSGPTFVLAEMKFFSETNAEATLGEICFSAQGTTYVRYVDNGVWAPLAGVPHYNVTNTNTTLNRVVYVPPNGVARLQL